MKKLDMRSLKDTMEMSINISDLPLFEVERYISSRHNFKVTVKELMERIDKLEKVEREASKARLALVGALNEALALR